MPKQPTHPYIIDEEKSISISDLKKLNYLKKNHRISGVINWKNRGVKTGSVTISVLITDSTSNIQFDYKCNNKKYKYNIQLVSLPSNLGRGKTWYFICLFTGKRCRKLHLINGKFSHRSILLNGMYSKQIQSKSLRQMVKTFSPYFDSDEICQELYSKHFKRFYKGKPTKRYVKLLKRLKQADKINDNDIKQLYQIK